MFLTLNVLVAQAQNDTIMTIMQVYEQRPVMICGNKYDRAIIYAPENCTDYGWFINNQSSSDNPIILDGSLYDQYYCQFWGCGLPNFQFRVYFLQPTTPNETTTELWKRQHETITLDAPEGSYDYLWSTGQTTASIEVIEPGTYTCGVSDMCATSVQTFIVRDNVELYRATVDLGTNLNKATWQTTPAQAQYINQVKVERDGMIVGTVPYTQGYFMDNIGSENAARNYRLTGILYDGTECPIPSYQKGTLSTFYSPDATDPDMVNMSWDAPFIEEGAPCSVTYFQICKYNASTGEVTVIDQLGANVHFGKYNMDLFDGEYGVVAALFNDGKSRDIDDLTFSNRSAQEILGIDELSKQSFKIYPNPSNGTFTVEGASTLTIYSVLGQIIATSQSENGVHTFTLAPGIYFIKSDEGIAKKVVVE